MSRGGLEFSSTERARYSRQMLLPEVGGAGQSALKQAKVLVVGVGGLGSPASLYLAAAGVGRIGLVEDDAVDESNLQRQILYKTRDIGMPKARLARERLSELNPHIEIIAHAERLTAENALTLIRDYDMVLDATDTFASRYLINDASVLARKPLVYASVSGFRGMISVVIPGKGPCFRCLHPEIPPPDATPSCAEGGVLGVVPGSLALLQATEVLKLVLRKGAPLVGRVLFYDALNASFNEVELKRNPRCAACGDSPSIRELTSCDGSITAAELADLVKTGLLGTLIDVREPDEFASSRIPGAVSIPLGKLADRATELDPQARLVVYCKSGTRSASALKILREFGFKQARHLEGGIDAYKKLDSVPGIP